MHQPRLSTSRGPRFALLCAVTALALGAGSGLARAATPGTLDTTFGSGGSVATASATRLFASAVQTNGDVVAVGESGVKTNADVLLARFTPAGAPDGSFGSGGTVHGPAVPTGSSAGSLARAVAIQSDGKIVVVGKATNADASARDGMLIERYNANGTLDTGFGTGGITDVLGAAQADGYAVAVQSDGKIVATGSADIGGVPYSAVVRLTAAGALDSTFGTGGAAVINLGTYSTALAVAIQSDGKIVIAGSQSPGGQVTNALIARLSTAGALDPGFAAGGAFARQYAPTGGAFSSFNALVVQSDGKIVAVGNATGGAQTADTIAARFSSAGAQDGSFGSGGVAYTPAATAWIEQGNVVPGAQAATIAGNGDIVAAGQFATSVVTYGTLWAFTPSGALDGTFGSRGAAVLTNAAGNNTEFAGVAVSPTTGNLIAAGDSSSFGGPFAGLVSNYGGYGPKTSPPPPPPPALKLTLTGLSKSYKTATVKKHGLKLSAGCNEACTLNLALIANTATARKLGLKTTVSQCKKVRGKRKCTKVKVYRPLTISPLKGSLTKAGSKAFVLKLSGAVAGALGKQKSIKLTLQVTATATATHKRHVTTQPITFTS